VMLEFESRERAKEWYNSIAGAMTLAWISQTRAVHRG
jgi:uncharacterized protein (DUF1330 family)